MNALDDYMSRRRQAIQEALESREATSQAQAGLTQARTAEDVGMAGQSFVDKLKEEGNKMQADMMTDLSSAGLAPTVLKGAARLATARANYLNSDARWRQVQARRFAEKEGLDPDEAAPDPDDMGATIRGVANDAIDDLRGQAGAAFDRAAGRAGQFYQNLSSQARQLSQRLQPPPAPEEPEIRFPNPTFEDPEMADPATMGVEVPEGAAGNITRVGQMLRQIRGAPTASTSQNIGDAINRAQAAPPSRQLPTPPDETATQREIMEQDPEENITGGKLQDIAGQAEQEAQAQIGDIGREAGEEAGEAIEDLAPEITSGAAGAGWSSLAGVLGDAVPLVGFGLGAWALGEGISDEMKSFKDSMTDPYAKVRPEIAAAQQKINNLQASVSADEFASKIGAGTPSFGSIAVRPQDTAMMSGIALHV